ncbi:HEAT repeat domain-containing protein [Kitasatospora sp. NBC_00240]|nr:HEAT repeat domain-containing protein [Kitasatospora sp. NBC_00240]
MNTTDGTPQNTRVAGALGAEDSSVRLQAALAVGSTADPDFLEPLVRRCAVETDFFVRDMLSWALTRLPSELTLPRIRRELASEHTQARSQALHTLSKIGDRSAWAWITRDMLQDPDDEVARTAWRVAVVLVPEDERAELGDALVTQLGRGDRTVQLSLSRAFVDLGYVIEPALEKAATDPDPAVATHAAATALLLRDPETGFDAAVHEAKRMATLGPEPAAALAATAAAAAASGDTEASEAAGTTQAAAAATTGSTEPAEAVEAADC